MVSISMGLKFSGIVSQVNLFIFTHDKMSINKFAFKAEIFGFFFHCFDQSSCWIPLALILCDVSISKGCGIIHFLFS